jgi:predicted nucleic acid-binding protein
MEQTTKTNTTAKSDQLSQINEEIKSVLNSINEFSEMDLKQRFNTRDGYIVANIKVYDYLSEEDIKEAIKENNAQELSIQILEEFDENRLNNIYNHVCENEVNYLKEKYEKKCDLTDFYSVFRVYNLCQRYDNKEKAILENNHLEYFIKTYFDEAKKHKTFESYQKAIKKSNEIEFKEFLKRDSIIFDCWQFGRSGGWFSICKKSELEQDYLYYHIGYDAHDLLNEDSNKTFNEIVNNLLNNNESKKQFLKRIKGNLEETETLFNNIESIVNDIEESKKHFKDCLFQQLVHEISELIEESENVSNVSIEIDGDEVKTSKGVSVLLIEFKANLIELMKQIRESKFNDTGYLPIKKKVGSYFVEYAQKLNDDFIIKAGCHKFSLNNILSKIAI